MVDHGKLTEGVTKLQMAQVIIAVLNNYQLEEVFKTKNMQHGLSTADGHYIHFAIENVVAFGPVLKKAIRVKQRESREALVNQFEKAFAVMIQITEGGTSPQTQPASNMEDNMARKTKEEKAAAATTPETTETVETPVVEEAGIDVDMLVKITEEINTIFGLNPKIDIYQPTADLEKLVREANKETLAADEKDLAPATWAWLLENGMIDHLKPAPKSADAVKPGPKAKPAGGAKTGGFTKQADTDVRNKLVETMIAEGKHTAVLIVDAVCAKFPEHKRTSIQTLVSDSKNPKYNKFAKLTIMNKETKILSF